MLESLQSLDVPLLNAIHFQTVNISRFISPVHRSTVALPDAPRDIEDVQLVDLVWITLKKKRKKKRKKERKREEGWRGK